MKIILLRGNKIRHNALAKILYSSGFLAGQVIEDKPPANYSSLSKIEIEHYNSQSQFEVDFFGNEFLSVNSNVPQLHINANCLNSIETQNFIKQIDFDLAITFGVSILKKSLINALNDKILGIHLGLSPYYRGSGTNFFPFVNRELEAIGFTLMRLDEGVDTGLIIHQGRAQIVLGDSIHTIGNRNINVMFKEMMFLLNSNFQFNNYKIPERQSTDRFYRRSDFNELSLRVALKNLEAGLVFEYITKKEMKNNNYPIFVNPLLS